MSALNPSFVQITENLSNTLKKKKGGGTGWEEKIYYTIEQLLKGKWDCGLHYNVETI